MNAQQCCLLHSKRQSTKDSKDVHPLAGRLATGQETQSSSMVWSNGSRSCGQTASDSPTVALDITNHEEYTLHSSEQSVEARPEAGQSPKLEASLPADGDAAFRLLCPEVELETAPTETSTAPGTAPQGIPDDARNRQDPGSPPLCTLIASTTGDANESTVVEPVAENETDAGSAIPELGLLEVNGCQASHKSGGLSEKAAESFSPQITALAEDLLGEQHSVTTDLLIKEALLEVDDILSPGQP